MNSNIFEIESKYRQLIDEIESNDGELTPELEESLVINEEDRDEKIEAYIHVIKQKEADNALIKDEIDRLRERQKVNNNSIAKLKNTIIEAMRTFELYGKSGNLSHSVGTYKLWTRKTQAVEVTPDISFSSIVSLKLDDLFNYKLSRKLTTADIKAINNIIELNKDDVVINPDKAAIKMNIGSVGDLSKVATVKDSESLTIK